MVQYKWRPFDGASKVGGALVGETGARQSCVLRFLVWGYSKQDSVVCSELVDHSANSSLTSFIFLSRFHLSGYTEQCRHISFVSSLFFIVFSFKAIFSHTSFILVGFIS